MVNKKTRQAIEADANARRGLEAILEGRDFQTISPKGTQKFKSKETALAYAFLSELLGETDPPNPTGIKVHVGQGAVVTLEDFLELEASVHKMDTRNGSTNRAIVYDDPPPADPDTDI